MNVEQFGSDKASIALVQVLASLQALNPKLAKRTSKNCTAILCTARSWGKKLSNLDKLFTARESLSIIKLFADRQREMNEKRANELAKLALPSAEKELVTKAYSLTANLAITAYKIASEAPAEIRRRQLRAASKMQTALHAIQDKEIRVMLEQLSSYMRKH